MVKLTDTVKDLRFSPTLWLNEVVQQKKAQNEPVYHMGFGQAPFPVPDRLKKALGEAAHRKEYLKAGGLQELCAAVKEYYRPVYGDAYIDNSDVLIAPGSKLILYALQMAVEGDLLMPVPSWVSYAPQAKMLGTQVIKVPTRLDESGYHIEPEMLRQTIHKAREEGMNPGKIVINTPNNPTGLVIPPEEIAQIAGLCKEEGIFIISDEIYGFLNFDEPHQSFAPFAPEITATSTGLSKHLSLGGWRLGIGFIPRSVDGLYGALCSVVSETWACVAAPVQQASVEAFKKHSDIEEYISASVNIHGHINRYISSGLQELGIKAPTAQGAFYNYPDFEPFREALSLNGIKTSQDLQEVLLNEYNLATLPGEAFGEDKARLTLRLSGCDYDGATALAAYANGEPLDRAFIERYAPHIPVSLGLFGEFLAKYGVLRLAV